MGRLEAIVLACIASATHGCGSSWVSGCTPPEREFTISAQLTDGELTKLQTDFRLDARDRIDCATVCRFAHTRDQGWEAADIRSCTFEVSNEPGMAPTAVAASVDCAGRAIEYYCEGRRPLGHVELAHAATGIAEHLAGCAHLEAAAVTAFDDLALALARWDAPSELVERCRRARAQEVEHAAAVAAVARRRGASVSVPSRTTSELSRLAVALDNAVEGCVHEAWAALRARWVAAHAQDSELRELYARIADDELEHAQLSWDLHAWLLEQLDAGARTEVEAALSRALVGLPELAAAQARALPSELGLPEAELFRAMAREFVAKLAA